MRDLVRLYATQLGKEQANWSRAAGRIPRLPGGIGEVDLPAGSHKLEATRHISGLTRPRSLGPAALCCCGHHRSSAAVPCMFCQGIAYCAAWCPLCQFGISMEGLSQLGG
jgi:hypothetical protein